MSKRRNNVNSKGRSKYSEERYTNIQHNMLSHSNFRALNGAAIKVLLGLCGRHNGFNNGKIFYSYNDLAKDLNISKSTAHRACKELEYFGFIKLITPGRFYGRMASEWEITFLKSKGYHPTNEWKKERPKKKKKLNPKKPIIESAFSDEEILDQRRKEIEARYSGET